MSERLQEIASGRTEPKRGFPGWIAGRARRREYWAWAVPWFVAVTAVSLMAPGFEVVLGPVLLCVWIRRLHDLGYSGWIAPLINIVVGVVGWIEGGVLSAGNGGGPVQGIVSIVALIALGAVPGQPRTNAYGPPPGRGGEDLAETFG